MTAPIKPFYTLGQKSFEISMTAALSAACVWTTHHVTQLKFLSETNIAQAAGFGLIAKTVTILITPHVNKYIITNFTSARVVSNLLGSGIAYGMSYGLAALGYVVAPTVITALILTVIAVALSLFFPPDHFNLPDGSIFIGRLCSSGKHPSTGKQIQKGHVADIETHFIHDKKRREITFNTSLKKIAIDKIFDQNGENPTTTYFAYDRDGKLLEKQVLGLGKYMKYTYTGANVKVEGDLWEENVHRKGTFNREGTKLVSGTLEKKPTETILGDTYRGTFGADESFDSGNQVVIIKQGTSQVKHTKEWNNSKLVKLNIESDKKDLTWFYDWDGKPEPQVVGWTIDAEGVNRKSLYIDITGRPLAGSFTQDGLRLLAGEKFWKTPGFKNHSYSGTFYADERPLEGVETITKLDDTQEVKNYQAGAVI